jgi:DNA-binding LytR/AlgR family response regulator
MASEIRPPKQIFALIVDRNSNFCAELQEYLLSENITSIATSSPDEALRLLYEMAMISVVILDVDTVGKSMFESFLSIRTFQHRRNSVEFIIIGSKNVLTINNIEYYNVICKPFRAKVLKDAIVEAMHLASSRAKCNGETYLGLTVDDADVMSELSVIPQGHCAGGYCCPING